MNEEMKLGLRELTSLRFNLYALYRKESVRASTINNQDIDNCQSELHHKSEKKGMSW